MNGTMTHAWLSDCPMLTALIVRFNTQLASSVDPSHIVDRVDEQLLHRLVQSPRAVRRLSKSVCRWKRLDPQGYYDFQPLWRRFALLDFAILSRLMLFVGAALSRRSLSQIIARRELQTVKASLGEDVFDFAIRRSRSISIGEAEDDGADVPTAEAVSRMGWAQLERCLAGESSGLTCRLQLKLPPEMSLDFTGDEPVASKTKLARRMAKILIREVQPELAPCFT